MAINKVEFDGQTLIDLTGDTVTQQDVLNGKSFHSADGVQRSGTASIPVSDVTVDGTSVVTNGVAEVVTDNLAPTVTEASSRTNLAVGDSLKTIIGKIKKFFSDLKTVAFTGSYNDLSDKPTMPDISTKVSKSGDTMSGVLTSSYKSSTWQNSWTNSVISLDDSVGSFGGWICGPTKNGRIAIQSYQSNDDKLYIGYATRGRTTNSNERQVCWNGATGKWECDITGNCDGSAGSVAWANVTGKPTILSDTLPILRVNTDIPEGAANLSTTATAHRITAYQNGFTIPYQMDNSNDGGIIRVRGTSESNCIFELGTWDDSGAGETIQFNYYPTTSQVTPTYSVSVPKKSGTIALTSDVPTNTNQLTNGAGFITSSGSCASATSATNAGHLSPLGGKVNSTTWGTITSANGYTQLYCTNQPGGGGYVVGEKGGQTSIQIDGDWYGQEGAKRCAYTSEALMKAGDTITGNLNIGSGGGYLNASASNGGINSIMIGDDVWLGDCNLGGIMGMKSTGANCGFRFYNSSGTHIGTLQSTAGTLQFNNSNVLVDGGTINITHQINVKNGAGILLYNAANNNYSDLYNSDNGTTFLRSAYGWVNICTNNSVQCRNFGDSNWVPCAGLRFDNKSSRRYKTNIIDFEEKDAKKLLSVKVVHYDYSDEVTKDKNNKYNQSGVIAEDVVSIIPEVVGYAIPYGHEDEFDEPVPDTVDYSKFVPYLIKMVQMQQKEIDQLKAEVAELKR